MSDPTATPTERKIIGAATPFIPVEVEAFEFNGSAEARRKHGWKLFQDLIKPTELREQPGEGPANLPSWQTWYSDDEFRAMVSDLFYYDLTESQRKAFRNSERPFPISEEQALRVIERHADRTLTGSDESRFNQLISRIERSLDKNSTLGGLNGVRIGAINLYSTGIIKQVLMNLHTLLHCRDTRPADQQNMACLTDPPQSQFGSCVGGAFPKDAAIIKAFWAAKNQPLRTFKTDARSLKDVLDQEKPSWQAARSTLSEDESIYTVEKKTLFQTVKYHLMGFHVTTKEVPEWVWATYWWTPRNIKNLDFGADRPDMPSPWDQYKMCAVTDFTEEDPRVANALAGEGTIFPSLRDHEGTASLEAAYLETIAPRRNSPEDERRTACSNPYLEHHEGWADSNCIGCHQHADVVTHRNMDEIKLPALCQQRSDFPGEFLWSIDTFKSAAKQELSNAPEIVKIAADNCGRCHSAAARSGNVILETIEQITKHKDQILCRIDSEDPDLKMPQGGSWVVAGNENFFRTWLKSRGAKCSE